MITISEELAGKLQHWRAFPAIVALKAAPNGDLRCFVLDSWLKFKGINFAVLASWHFPLF